MHVGDAIRLAVARVRNVTSVVYLEALFASFYAAPAERAAVLTYANQINQFHPDYSSNFFFAFKRSSEVIFIVLT